MLVGAWDDNLSIPINFIEYFEGEDPEDSSSSEEVEGNELDVNGKF